MMSRLLGFRPLILLVKSVNINIKSSSNVGLTSFVRNISCSNSRLKYNQHHGVKGIKNRQYEPVKLSSDTSEQDEFMLEDDEYDSIANAAMNVTRETKFEQNIFIIQPYIKWGPKKLDTNPQLQLQEAEALIRSIPDWNIELSLKVPLESLEKKTLFGRGKLKELRDMIQELMSKGRKISVIFVSKGTLTFSQKRFLEAEFSVPIMDRYSVVIQILRLHAKTTEAKLQVSMAEIPYIWSQMKDLNLSQSRTQGYYLNDLQKEMLRKRERKLKQELENVRVHRKLLRNKRKNMKFPIIAVVGYTNAGKTSLIKALTNEKAMQPRDQLFATLDVTAHAGMLPCNLEVIYMDTVGFMSDIPTGLIECFIATLEDAMMADIIIHVQDLAHENSLEQKKHVETTIKSLSTNALDYMNDVELNDRILNVGNKIDLLSEIPNDHNLKLVSSQQLTGITELLQEIEEKILKVTDRKKIIFRCSNGGEEMKWLYKNSAVTQIIADPKSEEHILINCVITESKMKQFKHYFCS